MGKQIAEIETRVTGDKKAKSKLGSLASFIKKRLVITMGDLARAGRKVITMFTSMIAASNKQEDAINTLNQALRNTGNFSEEASKDLQKYASAMQKVTKFGDEETLSAMSLIASFGIEGDELKALTTATLDLAQAKGFDLKSAADLVAKSVGSSTNALTRYGVEVTGAVGSTERTRTAVENMAKVFGGQATEAAKTFSGQTTQLANNMGDFAEQVGFIIQSKTKPFISFMSEATAKMVEFVKTSQQERLEVITGTDVILSKGEAIKTLDGLQRDAAAANLELLKKEKEQQLARGKEGSRYNKDIEIQIALYDKYLNKINAITEAEKKNADNKLIADEAEKARAVEAQTIADNKMAILISEGEQAEQVRQAGYETGRKIEEQQVKDAQTTSDLLGSITEDGGKNIGDAIKKRLSAEIDVWIATEVTKAQVAAPLSFGASLLAIAPIIAAGTAGKAAINAIPFAQGGQFERPNTSTTTSGQTAVDNEAGLERVTVEPIGQPDSNNGNLRPIQLIIQMDRKILAKQLYPEIQAIERSIS